MLPRRLRTRPPRPGGGGRRAASPRAGRLPCVEPARALGLPWTEGPPGIPFAAMTMAGQGVLAFWHDVAAGSDGEFDQWHLREHIPERVAVPGFLRARRYTTLGDPPRYFHFYETESVDTLQSPAYLARLADPTPWTKRTMPVVRNNKRTACRVVESKGAGLGGVIATLELGPAAGRGGGGRARAARTARPAGRGRAPAPR